MLSLVSNRVRYRLTAIRPFTTKLDQFFRGNPLLRQATARTPTDAIYPPFKPLDERDHSDVGPMVESRKTAELSELIAGFGKPLNASMTDALIKQVHDHEQIPRNENLSGLAQKLSDRLRTDHVARPDKTSFMTDLHYNMMVGGAARAHNSELTDQLLFESTVLGVPLDLQTFVRLFVHLDCKISSTRDQKSLQSEKFHYLTELMKRDLSEVDQQFADDFIKFCASQATNNEPAPKKDFLEKCTSHAIAPSELEQPSAFDQVPDTVNGEVISCQLSVGQPQLIQQQPLLRQTDPIFDEDQKNDDEVNAVKNSSSDSAKANSSQYRSDGFSGSDESHDATRSPSNRLEASTRCKKLQMEGVCVSMMNSECFLEHMNDILDGDVDDLMEIASDVQFFKAMVPHDRKPGSSD